MSAGRPIQVIVAYAFSQGHTAESDLPWCKVEEDERIEGIMSHEQEG